MVQENRDQPRTAGNGSFTPSAAPGSLGNDFPLFIGGELDGANLRGRIDELELYNRALPATEINRIYVADAKGKCKFHRTKRVGKRSCGFCITGVGIVILASFRVQRSTRRANAG